MFEPLALVIGVAILALFSGIKILKEFERAVVFRLGRLVGHRGPGLIFIIPVIERAVRVDLRTATWDIPAQDVITRDNVSVKVNAVLYFRVVDPNRAIVEVENFLQATSQLAQTTLRSVCGQRELDELLAERDRVNAQLQEMLDAQTDPWGIKVVSVELKHIDLPQEMQRAMARQAEAERERRAKVINAEGEFQAAQRLAEASAILAEHPTAVRLRFLQTLGEIASENNSTTIFPLPVDVLAPFVAGDVQAGTKANAPRPEAKTSGSTSE
jgi:regulator of protease activity HflC (stomatin/prohibitin superfamily)